MKNKLIILLIAVTSIAFSCKSNKNLSGEELEMKNLKNYLKENKITTIPTSSGLYYIETVKGTGEQPKNGSTVVVHYTGKFLDGKVFDSSVDRNEPFEFVLGAGQVIKGWDEGIAYMRKGGKATLIIPSKLGYGSRNIQNVIKPYSTLIFEVELLDIK